MPDKKPMIDRRALLKAGALAGAAGATGAASITAPTPALADAPKAGWSNWSGGQTSNPQALPRPTNEAELIEAITQGPAPIRAVGAGHSFSPLVPSDGTVLSLGDMTGVIETDSAAHQALIWAGTPIRDLGEPLWAAGMSLPNQGDIDSQAMAGAVGTSTHGTGINLPSLSSAPLEMRLITANGEAITCSPDQDADVFNAARCAMGSLGIISQMRIQCMPRYTLKGTQVVKPLQEILDNMDKWKDEHRHIEFWMFPYSDQALLKTLDETDEPAPPRAEIEESWPSEDDLLTIAVESVRMFPSINGWLQRQLNTLVEDTAYHGPAYQVFPSPRDVRFNEMEYQVPADRGIEAVLAVRDAIQKAELPLFFPIEYRYVKSDDVWLSPFQGRDSVSISVHQYHKQDYKEIFSVVEPVFEAFEGRPHWGKLHTKNADQLRALYPHWDEFHAVRRRLDPQGRFLNDHLRTIFGEST